MSKDFLVVGAGFSGAVLARQLVDSLDCRVVVIDARSHLGGNCHMDRDRETGIMIHEYGPHIFNTNHGDVYEYLQRFGKLRPFTNRVKAINRHGVFSLPINLLTINQFFGKTLNPVEAKEFVESLGDRTIDEPRNFEEQALKFIGADLYYAFFYGYSKKQWGCEPRELPASILKRLPVRFSYDDNYYASTYQGIPEEGYTQIVRQILDAPRIEVKLNTGFENSMLAKFDHIFYCGPIDGYFSRELGSLRYRTVTFERVDGTGDYQGNPVINYGEESVPFTRIHEHKHFAPWEKHEKTVAFREFSTSTKIGDIPYYPLRLPADMELFHAYHELAVQERNVSFIGRLGTYRYLDMDQVIGEAMDFAAVAATCFSRGEPVPAFGPQRSK